jgi:hypothetical protein
MWSALPPTTDMMRLHRHIGFVPNPEVTEVIRSPKMRHCAS